MSLNQTTWPIFKAHWSNWTKQGLKSVVVPSSKLVFYNGTSDIICSQETHARHKFISRNVNQIAIIYWFLLSKTFYCIFMYTYTLETVGWNFPWAHMRKYLYTYILPPPEGAVCPGFTACYSAHEEQHIQGHDTKPSLLYRRIWTKSSSYITAVFDKWTHAAPLQLQPPRNRAKFRCFHSPYIWLITAPELRRLLCLVPLSRKTMSIKRMVVI